MLLNEADHIYLGDAEADVVYLGNVKVWSAVPPVDFNAHFQVNPDNQVLRLILETQAEPPAGTYAVQVAPYSLGIPRPDYPLGNPNVVGNAYVHTLSTDQFSLQVPITSQAAVAAWAGRRIELRTDGHGWASVSVVSG